VLFAVFRVFRDPKPQRAEIEGLVYELYGLTEREIGVVEGLDHE